jgi:ribosomal protein S18 acetylase RimI-like enzyme
MTELITHPVLIRPATAADIEAMVALLTELFAIEVDFTVSPACQRRGLALMLEPEARRTVQVAEVEGRVVGMATAQVVISTAEGGESAWVEDVVVMPGFRGHGIGQQLLRALEQWAYARGIRRMQLVTDRGNVPARGFYVGMGWQSTQLICLRRVLSPWEVGG